MKDRNFVELLLKNAYGFYEARPDVLSCDIKIIHREL